MINKSNRSQRRSTEVNRGQRRSTEVNTCSQVKTVHCCLKRVDVSPSKATNVKLELVNESTEVDESEKSK